VKIVNSRALCIVGIIFFIKAGIVIHFFAKEPPPVNSEDYKQMSQYGEQWSQYVFESRIQQLVENVYGSVLVCLGSFLLLVYLKVRALEKRVAELQNNQRKENTPCSSAP
jgi:hypothetical protein